ncbi:MAG: glutathione S-transferase [Alsobacter sp.]
MDRRITFFHAPHSRSGGARILLEELGAPYDLHLLDLRAGTHREPAYLAVNPMGKVPAIRHGDALVTEQVAIFLYLADLFPEAGLAPAPGDALRGPYLRWMVFYAGCFEPAVTDHALKREPGPRSTMGYGDYDSTIRAVRDQLAVGPWMLGERFSAADVLWGTSLGWTMQFKIVPEDPVFVDYVARFNARPIPQRVRTEDSELAARQEAARNAAAGAAPAG